MDTLRTRIEIWREPSHRDNVSIASDFSAIVRSERLASVLDKITSVGGVIIAAIVEHQLRGYATLVPSSALSYERWENLPDTFELGSIEVARSARRRGIGTDLIKQIDRTLPIDDLLLFARGFAGHWDTSHAALSPLQYRSMLLRMLGRADFRSWTTDDPEVSDHPLNFFALRTGIAARSSSILTVTERAAGNGSDLWW